MAQTNDVTLHLTHEDALCVQDALNTLISVIAPDEEWGVPYTRTHIMCVVKAYVDLQVAKADNDEPVERRVAQFQPRTYR